MSKYDHITIFTKKENLLQYAHHARNPQLDPYTERGNKYYEREREVQLVLATRTERTSKGTRMLCKISCPINPLPVKGEFEVPSYSVIYEWLYRQGWTKKEIINRRWFE